MQCQEFQSWLSGLQPDQIQNIPEPARDHSKECSQCARSLKEAAMYQALLSERRPARQDEFFWGDYLQTVMKRAAGKEKRSQAGIWFRRVKWALVPAAAVLYAGILLIDREEFQPQDEVFTATYDVIWEEHNRVLSGYIFDPTSLYFVEDLIPENWENGTAFEEKN